MSEESEIQSNLKHLSEEDILLLKETVHNRIVSVLSFAEVIQIINNILIQEADSRIANMNKDEIDELLLECKSKTPESKETSGLEVD